MKKIILAGMLLTACIGASAQKEFNMSGLINGMEGKYLYLVTPKSIDSCMVKNHRFFFKGTMDKSPMDCRILTINSLSMVPGMKYAKISVEPGEMTMSINELDFDSPVVTGSKSQYEVDVYNSMTKDAAYHMKKLNEDYYTANEKGRDSIRLLMESYQKEYDEQTKKYLQLYPSTAQAASLLVMEDTQMSLSELQEAYNKLATDVKTTEAGKEIAHEIAALERTQPGKEAPLFEAKDVNGKNFQLKKLRGKYVLIDFWASWCVPCRKSNPHVKAIFDKYHKTGLDVVYVADDDSKESAWRKAIEKDGLQKMHHVLRGMKVIDQKRYILDHTNDVLDMYAIHFLPTKYLIDKNGKIIAKYNGGEEAKLDADLKNAFGF